MVNDEEKTESKRMPNTNKDIDDQTRRYFLRGILAVITGAALLAIGMFHKLFRFFFGPRLSEKQEAALMQTHLKRLQDAVALKKLELDREHNNYIFISAIKDLDSSIGKYFIDYQMRPGLAFLGDHGLPNLISAKCTHLGCTVSNQANDRGQILCPCHISYFDIKTGQPNPGSPAKLSLEHLSWVLMDKQQRIIAKCSNNGTITGNISQEAIRATDVYLAKPMQGIIS